MSEALKPCPNPWCESKESPLVFKDIFANGNPPYRGGCKLCRLYGPKAKTVAEARRLWNTRPVEDALVEALKDIRDNDGESCQRCEGNGRLWADGKAHLPSYQGLTRSCPQCDGKGRTFLDAKKIAAAALRLAGK